MCLRNCSYETLRYKVLQTVNEVFSGCLHPGKTYKDTYTVNDIISAVKAAHDLQCVQWDTMGRMEVTHPIRPISSWE